MLFREALQEEEDAYERVRACNRKCNKTSFALSLFLPYECGGDANYMTIAVEERRQRLYLSNSRRTVKKKEKKKETKKKIYLSLVA